MADSILASYDKVAERILAWDLSRDEADSLRQVVATLEIADGKLSETHTAIRTIANAYQKTALSRIRGLAERHTETAPTLRFIGPFIGDDSLETSTSQWLQSGWEETSIDDAFEYLDLVANTGACITDEMRELVRVLLHERKRTTWMRAADLAVTLGKRDSTLAIQLCELYKNAYRNVPKDTVKVDTAWPTGRLNAHTKDIHDARHMLYWGCAWLADGGEPDMVPNLSVEALAAASLEKLDDSDTSVVLAGLGEVVCTQESADTIIAGFTKQLEQLEPHYTLCDEMLRRLYPKLQTVQPGVARSIHSFLSETRWHKAPLHHQAAAAWSWLQSLRMFLELGDTQTVTAMTSATGPTETAALWMKSQYQNESKATESNALDDILDALRTLLSATHFQTSTANTRTAAYATCYTLLQHPYISSLDWRSLLQRATPSVQHAIVLDGAAGEIGPLNVWLLLQDISTDVSPTHRLQQPAQLAHQVLESLFADALDAELRRDITFRIIQSKSERYQNQAALLFDTLLREGEIKDRIRLIWQVLRVDANPAFFRSLERILRSDPYTSDTAPTGNSTFLPMIKCAAKVDEVRYDLERLPSTYLDFIRVARHLCTDEHFHTALNTVETLTAFFTEQSSRMEVPSEQDAQAAVSQLETLLGTQGEGIYMWPAWLDGEPPQDKNTGPGFSSVDNPAPMHSALIAWENFRHSYREFKTNLPRLTSVEFGQINEIAIELEQSIRDLGWPETKLLVRLIGIVKAYVASCREAGHEAEQKNNRILKAINEANEDDCIEISADESALKAASNDNRKQLNVFLQRHMLLAEAKSVQATIEGDYRTNGEYLRPQFLGAAAGTFFLMDSGERWLKLVHDTQGPHWLQYGVTIGCCLILSLGLLAWDIRRKMQRKNYLKAVKRLLPTFVLTVVIATFVSLLVGWTTEEMDPTRLSGWQKLPLWTSLSLFLGVFIHLIVDGKNE